MTLVSPDLFAGPEGTYLLSHALGLPRRNTATSIEDGVLTPWRGDPASVWAAWLEEIAGFRRALADLLDHQPEWFCPQVNVSSALTKILHALPRPDRKRTIVVSEHAFPSVGFVCQHATSLGYRVEITRSPDTAELWTSRLKRDVAVAVLTHVHPNTGTKAPVQVIIDAARQHGVVTVVDIAQSAGVVPISLDAWQPDFAVGSCVKWVCGGPGAGYLWVNPNILESCRPVDVGWFSHADPFELDTGSFRYAEDALRFWGGTPSVLPFAIARRAIDVLVDVGIQRIRAHNLMLTGLLIDAVQEDVLVSPRGADRGGTVVIDAGPRRTKDLLRRFAEDAIHVDQRSLGIRISPHMYNSTTDVQRVIDAMQSEGRRTK